MPSPPREAAAGRARAANRYLRARGDDALGLAPQRLLPPGRAAGWACFWAACRRMDDALDTAAAPPGGGWRRWLGRLDGAGDDLAAALGLLPEASRRALAARFDGAWRAMRRRAAWRSAPPLGAYLRASATLAGLPMRYYYRLALPGHPGPRIDAAADLLGASIQAGDDARDLAEDLGRGVWTVTRQELAWLGVPEEPAAVLAAGRDVASMRQALAARLLAEAVARLPVPTRKDAAAVLGPVLLWRHAMVTGQFEPTRRPLRLPSPQTAADARDAAAGRGTLYDDILRRSSGLPGAGVSAVGRLVGTLQD